MVEDVGIDGNEILVITFSKKAAKEMEERYKKYSNNKNNTVCFGTFHAIFYSIVKEYYKFSSNSILKDSEKVQIVKRIFNKISHTGFDTSEIDIIVELISVCKSLKDIGKTYEQFLMESFDDDEKRNTFEKIKNEYIYVCRKENKLDFDDMLYMCRELLQDRPDVLDVYRNMYKYIFVDEFQDINKVQYDVLKMLSGESKNVFAVGDDDQSIYGFRGSRPELMKSFIEDYSGCKVINMNKNYRSAKCVIDIASFFIKLNKTRIDKAQVACKADKEHGKVVINVCGNAIKEAEYICEKIKMLEDNNYNLSDVAIIFRTFSCIGLLREKMSLMGIPYSINNNSDGFYNNEYVRDIISYIKIALGKSDIRQEISIINKPERNLSIEEIISTNGLHNSAEPEYVKVYLSIKKIENMSCFAAVTFILKGLGYEKYLYSSMLKKGFDDRKINEFINDLLDKSKSYSSLGEWMGYIDICLENEANKQSCSHELNKSKHVSNDEYKGSVTLITAHASKGLEYETVFIVGLQEGIFPGNKVKTMDQIEEERRLLYVAMTRAKKYLYIIGRGEDKHGKKVSRFVEELRSYTWQN